MQGRRLPDAPDGFGDVLAPGEYVKLTGGDWVTLRGRGPIFLACTPNGYQCNLANHSITEHEDGTVTAAPSILIRAHADGSAPGEIREVWHGYLERGMWRDC